MGPVSDGIPAWIASIFLRKPLVIRLGGDFVWERSLELGKTSSPLRTFYHKPQDMFNRLLIAVVKAVLKGATRIIFSTNFQKEIYERDLRVSIEKGVVIENPVPVLKSNSVSSRIPREPKEILFAGRLIRKNNLETLLHAFAGIVHEHKVKLRIIGEGPREGILRSLIEKLKLGHWGTLEGKLQNKALLHEVQGVYLVVLPALTDVSPNFALECLSIGVPILLTRETGFYEKYQDQLLFFDPTNHSELRGKIIALLDQSRYERYSEVIKNLKFNNCWDDVVSKHIMVFSEVLKS
jgi:glycosyltransferase involved in cell wall biosynthesis